MARKILILETIAAVIFFISSIVFLIRVIA